MIKRVFSSSFFHEDTLVVDVGCGTGDLLSYLATELSMHNLLGLDISKVGIMKAREKFPNLNFGLIEFNELGLHSLDIKSRAGVIICSEVLEHLEKPDLLLKFILKNLVSSGTLIVTVPGGPMSYLEKYIGHQRHYTKNSLIQLLQESGLKNLEVLRAGFPGINVIRLVSILRGSRILNDLAKSSNDSILLKFGFRIAELILRYSAIDSRFGWQLIAICRLNSSN